MTAYVVKGEMLHEAMKWVSAPIDKLVPLKQQHSTSLFLSPILRVANSYLNHGMEAVIWGLNNTKGVS